jgi:hypothetical protein
MADFINHITKVNGVLWCVDKIHLIEDDKTVTITGWISHIMQPVKSFIINDRPHYPIFTSRPDVKEFYPLIPTDEVGFEITLSIKDLDKSVSLVLQDSSMVDDIGTFEKWGLFYSGFNPKLKKGIVVVDNFYDYPDWVREYAMNNLDFNPSGYHKGQRSSDRLILEGTKEKFEEILGKKITNWNHESYANGVFQYCTSQDPIVYHVDSQTYAAMVYLTPDAPLQTGTATYKSKITGATRFDKTEGDDYYNTFKGLSNNMNFYDSSTYEVVDTIANVYNRLVMFDSKSIHAATGYFGDAIENARFFHLFFFDVEW